MMNTATELSLIGVADADHMRTQKLQSNVIYSLKEYVAKRVGKKQKTEQATLFCDNWIKNKVMRALFLHNLEMQK